jgi:hypothetical protein
MTERPAAPERSTKTDAEDKPPRTEEQPLIERLRPVIDRIAARSPTGLDADKGFYDELGGED